MNYLIHQNLLNDPEILYLNNTCYFIEGKDIKYILSVLNSKTIEWFFNWIATSSGVGTNRWIRSYVEQIPVPEIPKPAMRPFEILVDYVTFIKKYEDRISPYTPNDHIAANFEELIDACVFELFFRGTHAGK